MLLFAIIARSMPSLDGHEADPSKNLLERLNQIRERIDKAARHAGKNASDIYLVAVTKTVTSEIINQAIGLGIKDIGENKLQEALSKWPHLNLNNVTKHFIGHLQSNKAKKAVENFDVIQSVDSLKLATVISRSAVEMNKVQSCLIEVKISNEESKSGVPFQQVEPFFESVKNIPHIDWKGFMTIGALGLSTEETRESFRQLKIKFDQFKKYFGPTPILSMGMSEDFEMAIEEGSTMVRVGRALFGERILK